MSVLTGALGSLAPKLLQLLHGEYKLQKGVKKQVESLSHELKSIYAFLHRISDVPWDQLDEQVKLWACEVREASYDMEDVIDTFLVRVDRGNNDADSSSLKLAMTKMGDLFRKARARRDIAGEIKDITKHLEGIAERRQKYKLDEIVGKPLAEKSTVDPRLQAMYREVTQLIGVDKSKAELISMLKPSQPDDGASNYQEGMKKVSIVGVGGLGKTTLAKAVNDKLKSQYDCGAFVSVGRDHDLVKVFKVILFDLDSIRYHDIHNIGRGVHLLIREVREFLKNKRYFVVVDDVWEVQTWGTIKLAFVDYNCGSELIITTRKLDVAQEVGLVYKLKPLSYDDSMKLFNTRIYGASGKSLYNQLDHVSDKIIKKCAGIPLAIITMSSLFAGIPEYEWPEIYNSIGFDAKGNREAEDTMKIISFSYYELPPHLRTCLLYLSTYPEDSFIEKDRLIWKWIAEGFITGDHGIRLFEIGERYFNNLINRSLIHVEDNKNSRVSGCRVHDMVLDLIRKLSSEGNFIATLGDNVEGTPALSNVRRLTHQNRKAEHINSEAIVTGMPKVRSYTAFRCFFDSQDLFLRFKFLRVLDIVDREFKKGCCLEHLGDLIHLRYLGIRCQDLPKQIGNLKLLQTIDVQEMSLPESIVHLTELVRLHCWNKVPDGICSLVSLEELRIINGCSDKPKRFLMELGSLQELRVLEFSTDGKMDESMQGEFVHSLSNLQKVQYIELGGRCWYADTSIWEAAGFVLPRPLQYLDWGLIKFSKLPSSINPSRLPNLSHLRLAVNTLDEQDLKLLAGLPALCHLYLETKSTVTARNINASDALCFPKLRYLRVNRMVHFEQPSEDDTAISLHIWNEEDTVPFGSRKIHGCCKVVPHVVVPNLEVLEFPVHLRPLKDNNHDCSSIGLEYLPSIRVLYMYIYCAGVSAEEVDDALSSLKNACKIHPNHPTLNTVKFNEENMVLTQDKENEKQQEEAGIASQAVNNVDLGELSPACS